MSAICKPNELRLIRVFDAPIEVVWDAWTDVEQVAQWWGPRGFTITTHGKELRPGGFWDYTMHGPDGTDYPNVTIYHEVEERRKLVYDHGGSKDRPPLFRVTALFTEEKGKTKLDMTMAFESPEVRTEMGQFIKKAGGDSTWDRLAEYLGEKKGKKPFFINRSFDVPFATMYEVWSQPEHVSKWLPPTGFTMKYLRADLRPGGSARYVMTSDDGKVVMHGRASYLEMVPPRRLVYTQEFCDENENISRHPFAPVWPATMLTSVELTEESPDRTRVTIMWEPYGEATSEEIAFFMNARPGMTQGWTGSFDKLEAYLVAK